MTKTAIRIESDLHGGNTPVGAGGRLIKIPHNTDFPIDDEHLAALRDSNVSFQIVDGAAEQPDTTAGAGGASAPAETSAAPEADPLDHDGDGRKGGSKPGTKRKRKSKKAATPAKAPGGK